MSGCASGGGLIQMVAIGVQDAYLTLNPTITFWRSVYKRYTNFAQEHITQSFNGSVRAGTCWNALVSRNGDLLHRGYLRFNLPAIEPNRCKGATGAYWTNVIGHALIDEICVTVGGQAIDRQLGVWMNVWTELTNAMDQKYLGEMIGRRYTIAQLKADAQCPHTYYVPLLFWFALSPGNALPLIALQYHEVRILVCTKKLSDLWISEGADVAPVIAGTDNSITDNDIEADLLLEYVYLDGEERANFAQSQLEYLIQQVQFTNEVPTPFVQGSCQLRIELNFNHPVRALQWIFLSEEARCAKNWGRTAKIPSPLWTSD